MHWELVAVVHVRELVQFGTAVHGRQTLAGPLLSSQKPDAHSVHCEVVALEHVTAEMQWSTPGHSGHESARPCER